MPRRNRILAAVFIALVVALVVYFKSRVPAGATAADGRRVTIEKITYGTQHSFTTGKLWVRVLKPVLGAPWAAKWECIEIRRTNTEPGLMVWTRWTGVSATNPLPVEATILDEHGTESEFVVSRWNQTDWWNHTNRFESINYVGWLFQNYPRRSRRLSMRIYDGDQQHRETQAVQLSFANPGPKRHPQWSGQQLPITRTNGRTEFTLKAVGPSKQVHFQMHTDGQPDPSWQVGGITTRDATGNSVTRQIMLAPGLDRNRLFTLPGVLWPGEQVWRFSVEFSRSGDFEGHELWTTPSLPLQSASAGAGPSITNWNLNGSRVIVVSPQWKPQTMPWPGRTGQNAEVRAWLSPGSIRIPHRLFFVGALDDQNRELQSEPLSSMTFGGSYAFEFRAPSGAKSVSFIFAVRKSTLIDFDVAAESVLPQSKARP